ncbi:hypothetical protein PCG10_008222 [Penicillium crustosum]|uniref:Uncharacterized protein n=1 Tax=Penicillium crustosum TaxID=36656 RepID=A0A9P5GIB5_PENCR|nr:hypothetical protein PCG10_008222 [Penicillium crustosum]
MARTYPTPTATIIPTNGSRHYNSGNGDAVYTLPPAPAERYQESDNYASVY